MTSDKDFKTLIRARMAKTGESYVTARQQLLRQRAVPGEAEDGPAPPPAAAEAAGSATTFRLGSPEGAQRARSALDDLRDKLYGDTGAELVGGDLHVWMGQPRAFEITIPLSAIREARRAPDKPSGGALGVHGSRGRWLVNASYENLLTLTLDPPQKAALSVASSLPAAVREKTPWFVRPLLRDRAPKVRELTISVDDPDALLLALSSARRPSDHRDEDTE